MRLKSILTALSIVGSFAIFSNQAYAGGENGDPRDLNNEHGRINNGGNFNQGVTPNNNGGGGDTNTPIDGGLTLLLAAGIGYGVKKANDKRKAAKAEEVVK